MKSIMIALTLAAVGSVAFAQYDANTAVPGPEHDVALYANPDVPEYLEPLFSWPPGSFVDCGECAHFPCGMSSHWFLNGPYDESVDRSYGEQTHGCEPTGDCPTRHPQGTACDQTRDPDNPRTALSDSDKQMIWETGTAGIPSSLTELVETFGAEVVAYNPARDALQVRGCQGAIIMRAPRLISESVVTPS